MREGEPCSHPGCLSHISHPCEVCGRIGGKNMDKPKICPVCDKGIYKYGSGLYDYYTCNHAYEKPLNNDEKGKFIYYPSPYEKKKF